ncbi:hypothetical protein XFF6166_580001 [Xanthomonas citri pv. fuscans]|nr:hypothetical protein XFF6166_580001 [Xanthomonas citri pv. fuscans]SOO03233.1 hypothetical protein XFF6960_810005 [Xanthomonas citri pv. fuscans]SOO05891.1 hypothetical protein XFF7767_500005 [Xanthomonas citri pv. fuscans]SOO10317.1 hypothetical protein XFF6970_530001 [Xanthomonas citri pv. fuscans]SOO16539.1 hypothetical protein XFF7766_800001 [Xanthomonas citri pv. fuscans]
MLGYMYQGKRSAQAACGRRRETGLAGIRAKNSKKWDNLLLVKNFFADSCRPSISAACTAE